MKQFTSLQSVSDLSALLQTALAYKKAPARNPHLGAGKTLVLLFFNPSLRTRLSTQKAAQQLGLSVITMNAAQGWKLAFEDQVVMDGDQAEHIREAAAVISQYADIIGVRSFPGLQDREKDYSDYVMKSFVKYAEVPVISLESAILHPLQSLTDWLTIETLKKVKRPKVVLSWAPHPKALPQAVANSFLEWSQPMEADIVMTHPPGYSLDPKYTAHCQYEPNQAKALAGADFVYVKNWSSYEQYGQILNRDPNWIINADKLAQTNNAYLMHCLPVRRNVVISDDALDSSHSVVIQQAENRRYAAQAVLDHILTSGS